MDPRQTPILRVVKVLIPSQQVFGAMADWFYSPEARNPQIGHTRPDLTTKPVRFWPIYSYLIVYDPQSRPLEIVRILSGYRDIAALLK